MKPLLTVLKFAAIPAIIVGYVAFMGSTGFCPTCVAMVDWATGRSANASVVPATAAVAAFDQAVGDQSVTATPARLDSIDAASPTAVDSSVAAASDGNGAVAGVAATEAGPIHRLELPSVDGRSVRLGEFAGKPMLIEVWATWCAPCVRVRSMLKAASPRISSFATIVAVSVDQGRGGGGVEAPREQPESLRRTALDARVPRRARAAQSGQHDPEARLRRCARSCRRDRARRIGSELDREAPRGASLSRRPMRSTVAARRSCRRRQRRQRRPARTRDPTIHEGRR